MDRINKEGLLIWEMQLDRMKFPPL
jgi:hypothetical protein